MSISKGYIRCNLGKLFYINVTRQIFPLFVELMKEDIYLSKMLVTCHSGTIPNAHDFEPTSPYGCVLSIKSANTNFIVFGLTRLGLEPTTYQTR